MKTLKLIIGILIVTFIVDKCVFYTLNYFSDHVFSGQGVGKVNHYLKIKDTTDVFFYGSSRVNHSIDPSMIKKQSFNMGVDGKTISFSKALIKLLPVNKEQVIVLHIDPNRAIDSLYTGADITFLATKYHRNSIVKKEIDELNLNNTLQSFYWCLDYNGVVLPVLKNYFFPKYNYKTYNGYDPIVLTSEQKNNLEKVLNIPSTDDCTSLKINPFFKNGILDVKKFAKENNKKLIIFTSPAYTDPCKKDNILLKNFLKENSVIYYDYTDFFKTDNSFDYWKDKIHLSKKGAEIFTSEIKNIIR